MRSRNRLWHLDEMFVRIIVSGTQGGRLSTAPAQSGPGQSRERMACGPDRLAADGSAL